MKQRHINTVKKLCKKSTSKFRLACIITYKNKLISKGINNMTKTHPMSTVHSNTLHAEISAISKVSSNLSGCTAYIYRELNNGDRALAKPCSHCMKKLKLAGIKKICYTCNNGSFKEELI